MGLGKATVITRTPTTEEYVDHGRTGLLVEPGNAQALAGAIQRLLDNADERHRIGTNARVEFEQRFSRQATFRSLYACVRQLVLDDEHSVC